MLLGLGREASGELLLSGYRVSVWDDGKVLQTDPDNCCTTVCVIN